MCRVSKRQPSPKELSKGLGQPLLFFTLLQHFGRASVRHFLCSVKETIGPLTFLRIWHDNSGEGNDAGWFLDKVVVEDLQTNQR